MGINLGNCLIILPAVENISHETIYYKTFIVQISTRNLVGIILILSYNLRGINYGDMGN